MKKGFLAIACVAGVVVAVYYGSRSSSIDVGPTAQETQTENDLKVDLETKLTQNEATVPKAQILRSKPVIDNSYASQLNRLLQTEWTSDELSDLLLDIESDEELDDPVIIDLLVSNLDKMDSDLQISVMEMIANLELEGVLDFARLCFESEDVDVRIAVMDAMEESQLPGVSDLLVFGLSDKDEYVREAAISATDTKERDVVMDVVRTSLDTKYNETRIDILDLLDNHATPESMNLLINELNHKNRDYRESVNEKIFFFISEEFETQQEAKRWWQANKQNFDEELQEID